MKNVRIIIPRNATLFLALLLKAKTKHEALAAASPLAQLDWATFGTLITSAIGDDVQAADLHRQAEVLTERRDAALPDLNEFARSIRDVLVGLNRSNPRVLSDFGFVVNDSAPPAPTPPPTA